MDHLVQMSVRHDVCPHPLHPAVQPALISSTSLPTASPGGAPITLLRIASVRDCASLTPSYPPSSLPRPLSLRLRDRNPPLVPLLLLLMRHQKERHSPRSNHPRSHLLQVHLTRETASPAPARRVTAGQSRGRQGRGRRQAVAPLVVELRA